MWLTAVYCFSFSGLRQNVVVQLKATFVYNKALERKVCGIWLHLAFDDFYGLWLNMDCGKHTQAVS